MGTACLGDCGSHLITKYNTIGACAAMRSCQMCAAAPSSAWGAAPCVARNITTVARAPTDIATGRKALGCFSVANRLISKVRQDSAHALPRLSSEYVIETKDDRHELCIEMRAKQSSTRVLAAVSRDLGSGSSSRLRIYVVGEQVSDLGAKP